MKRYIRVVIALMTVTAMLVSMSACGENTADPSTAYTTVTHGGTTVPTTAPTAVTGDPSSDPSTPPEQLATGYNLITGLDDMGGSDLTRPVGVMVANNDFIQDEQVGIGEADMWVEAETEGGITRIMAVFANSERVPASIGPVRSARTPFVRIAKALGLGYVHAGGSYTALNLLANAGMADMDVNGGSYSWRDNNYPHAYEYKLRTGGEKLTQYMSDRGYTTTAVADIPWTFGFDKPTGDNATDITVKMSYAQTIGFTYDAASGTYQKTNGSSKTPHYDGAGNAIRAKTVIVLYTDKIMENSETHDLALGYGEGYIFSDGVARRFDWSRDDSGFTMTEKDGTKLTIAQGKVYLCAVSSEHADNISY